MPYRTRAFRALIVALMLALAAPAGEAATLSDTTVGFSALRTLVFDGKSYVGRMFAMPGRERHEQKIQGFSPVFLLRGDNPVADIVLAQLHTVVQFALPPELRVFGSRELKKRPLGRDTVNGVATTKYAIDETVPEGHAAGTLWLSAEGIPMRLAGRFTTQNGKNSELRWELKEVKVGPQPAALFEAPAGYSKLPPEAVAPLLGLRLKSASRR